jgi:hypothetical protein
LVLQSEPVQLELTSRDRASQSVIHSPQRRKADLLSPLLIEGHGGDRDAAGPFSGVSAGVGKRCEEDETGGSDAVAVGGSYGGHGRSYIAGGV